MKNIKEKNVFIRSKRIFVLNSMYFYLKISKYIFQFYKLRADGNNINISKFI